MHNYIYDPETGKYNTKPETFVKKIADTLETRNQINGHNGNNVFRMTGIGCDSYNSGCLEIGNKEFFDKFGNSVTITIDLNRVYLDGGDIEKIIKDMINYY